MLLVVAHSPRYCCHGNVDADPNASCLGSDYTLNCRSPKAYAYDRSFKLEGLGFRVHDLSFHV